MQNEYSVSGYDAIVVGGSYAGLSAALQLARARRRLLVVDSGLRRNRFAESSHGFLTHDGHRAGAITAEGRRQLLAYPNVRWLDGTATMAARSGDGFVVTMEAGQPCTATRLVLATGVVDELPALEGLMERWGRSIFHCPYCHGYELNEGHVGVLATGPLSLHHAMLLPDWGQVTFFTNGNYALDADQLAALEARGVAIEPERILSIVEHATVELGDGRRVTCEGLFAISRVRMASPLAAQLDCAFDEGPLGAFIRTDASKQTTVPGVFACGDAARMAGNVAMAVGDGAQAGAAAHQSMIFS